MLADLRHSEHLHEAARFFFVALAGLVLDVSLAWLLIAALGAPDPLAAAAGFSSATVFNYFAHQFWTFRSGHRAASLRRFIGFSAVVTGSFLVRLGVLHILGGVLPGPGIDVPIRLGLAAGVSFLVAFPLSRLFVFRLETDR